MTKSSRSLPVIHAKSPRSRARRAVAAPRAERKSRLGQWRAICLASVYLLIGIHIAHWKLAGRTLAPLELNEVMYTLELGIITAGFLFMAIVLVGTLVFGRFFCSWACHILALQDLCAWLLEKLRIRPKPVRARLLLLVAPTALFYMFVWPQISRVLHGQPAPALHLRTDAQGWASFITENFWRNLPDGWVVAMTFAVCGFAIVYVLGSRSFCTYACPYGALFRIADKFAPGRIVAKKDCHDCGACTAACNSHVRVHEELVRYGTVVNDACLRDLDCVTACPDGEIAFGFTRPPILRSWFKTRKIRVPYDFAWWEEMIIAIVFLATLFTFRGLYDSIPFLLTLGLGCIIGYLSVVAVRLYARREVRLSHCVLKQSGRLRAPGVAYLAGAALFVVFFAHSAFVRLHEYRGYRAADPLLGATHATSGVDAAQITSALEDLETAARWGLLHSTRQQRTIGGLHASLAELLMEQGQFAAAAEHFDRSVAAWPSVALTHFNYGVALSALNRNGEALREYSIAVAQNPADSDAQNNYGFSLAQSGEFRRAEEALRAALESQPRNANAHFNLARVLLADRSGRVAEAEQHFREAARLDPGYAELLRQTGR